MTTSRTRGAVVAVALLATATTGTACGRAAVREATTTVAPASTPTPVPLVLETGAPPRPPAVALVVHAAGRDVVVHANPLFGPRWPTDDDTAAHGGARPVPWPRVTTIAAGATAVIALSTAIVPDYVVVKSFTTVAVGTHVPDNAPIATFSCDRFTAPQCTVTRAGAGIRVLGLDQTIFRGRYLVIYCEWHRAETNPTMPDHPSPHASDSLLASWLLRVDHRPTTVPSP